jgi:glycosyltransferase involved in cell wall biosynthesis
MKISVITINRNNVAGLKKTFASVIAQTHNDVEFIVIDGASTDGSVDVIKTHAEHISQWISEPDTGIYNAMNKGIARATGDYLIFMNAGDSFADNTSIIQFVNGHFQESIVFGNQIRLYPDGRTDLWQVNDHTIDFIFFARRGIPHQSTFIQRTIFEKLGSYREDLPIYADWELVARAVLVHGASIRHIPQAVCIYDMDGMSTNTGKDKREAEKTRARLGLFSQQVWDTALECYDLRNELKKLKSKKLVKLMTQTSRLLK